MDFELFLAWSTLGAFVGFWFVFLPVLALLTDEKKKQ